VNLSKKLKKEACFWCVIISLNELITVMHPNKAKIAPTWSDLYANAFREGEA
jgi:hypothetical protein